MTVVLRSCGGFVARFFARQRPPLTGKGEHRIAREAPRHGCWVTSDDLGYRRGSRHRTVRDAMTSEASSTRQNGTAATRRRAGDNATAGCLLLLGKKVIINKK